MTVIIDFPDGTDQVMSNWYYRQIKQDIREMAPDDDALNFEIEGGGAIGLLSLDEASREMQDRIMRAMRFVAEQILAGEIPGWQQPWPENDDGTFTRVHLKVVTELLGNVNRFLPDPNGGFIKRIFHHPVPRFLRAIRWPRLILLLPRWILRRLPIR